MKLLIARMKRLVLRTDGGRFVRGVTMSLLQAFPLHLHPLTLTHNIMHGDRTPLGCSRMLRRNLRECQNWWGILRSSAVQQSGHVPKVLPDGALLTCMAQNRMGNKIGRMRRWLQIGLENLKERVAKTTKLPQSPR